jgi:hypothetical protein
MSFIVYVSWLNPNQRMDLYPEALKGSKFKKLPNKPQQEYFVFASEKEARSFVSRIEQHVRVQTYGCVDDDNKPIYYANHRAVVHDPKITLIDNSDASFFKE